MEDTKVNYVAPQVEVIYDEYPPIFDRIKEAFPLAGEKTIFAYGDKVYVPSGKQIPPEILAHEKIHCERQMKMGLAAWWDQYLVDPHFRFKEELIAHQVEYHFLRNLHPGKKYKGSIIEHVAKKLSNPLYGGMCSFRRAVELLKKW